MEKLDRILLKYFIDFHMHFRQDEAMEAIWKTITKKLAAGMGMPNTTPSLQTIDQLLRYRDKAYSLIGDDVFMPFFTLFLSPDLQLDVIEKAWKEKLIIAVKYFPQGATTNSDNGAKNIASITPHLELMQRLRIPLSQHGETVWYNGKLVGDFFRESTYYSTEGLLIRERFPSLPMANEHLSTITGVQFTEAYLGNTIGTFAAQHVMFDNRSMFNLTKIKGDHFEVTNEKSGGFPDYFCRPFLQFPEHVEYIQQTLIKQANGGPVIGGLGSDTAFHLKTKKYADVIACGMFPGEYTPEFYAMALDHLGILPYLPEFIDVMPKFYGINNIPEKPLLLEKKPQLIPTDVCGGTTPFSGQVIPWTASMV